MNYKLKVLFSILAVIFFSAKPKAQDLCLNERFENRVNRYLSHTVPTISVEELAAEFDKYLLLDAREQKEHLVSTIPGAVFTGYKEFDAEKILKTIPKNQPIVVFCSIGYRSEKIGERLQEMGYLKVYNLFGSIFEWANRRHPLVDPFGNSTLLLHTYNSRWSRWVENERIQKVW